MKSQIHSSISRALSSNFMTKAIDEAITAKSFAEEGGSKRHIGNAEFALGEAYRLNKQYMEASKAYESGLSIAFSLGNKDLEIYCKLGLTATMLAIDDLDSKLLFLSELDALDPGKFPVESLHFKLLNYIFKLIKNETIPVEDINQIESDYKNTFSRVIPGHYLKELSSILDINDRKRFVIENPIRF